MVSHRLSGSSHAGPVRPLKVLVVALSVALGALFAVGFLLAALFERQGFGSPRDQPPRTGYLLELAAGFAACVAIPALLSRRLLHAGPAGSPPERLRSPARS